MRFRGFLASVLGICTILACTLPSALGLRTPMPAPSPTPVVEFTIPPTTSKPITIAPTEVAATTPVQQPPTQAIIPTPSPLVVEPGTYAVVLVQEDDVLNVRSGAGVQYPILDTLHPQATGIRLTGKRQPVGESLWVEILRPVGGTGWVNAFYLTEEVKPERFCADARVNQLIADFVGAVLARDGQALAQLVSPQHGLMIRYEWWNPEVSYRTRGEVEAIFNETTERFWGNEDGSGFPIRGSFRDVILPRLMNILDAEYSLHCNILEVGVSVGGTAGLVVLPYEYANFRYVALYRPAPPDMEMD